MALSEYAAIVRKRWLLLVVVIAVGCAAAVFGGRSLGEPAYTASSRLIVKSGPPANQAQPLNQADLQVSIMLINTYKELIVTPPIMQEVIQRYPALRLSPDDLGESLKVTTKAGSQIMTISWEDSSYERAADIVNAVADVFVKSASKWVNTDNVAVLSLSDPADRPAAPRTSVTLLLLIGLVCSVIVALLLVFLLEALDQRLRRPVEVERTLEYPVLVAIGDLPKKTLKELAAAEVPKMRVGEEPRVHVNG